MLKSLIQAFLVVNGAHNFIFNFLIFGQNARWTLKLLYLDQIKLIEITKSTLAYYFLNAVLLRTRNQALFYRLGIKF